MKKITDRVKDLARCYGAGEVGIITTEMLEGGPPSTDLTYVLSNAKSAVSFGVPLDQNHCASGFIDGEEKVNVTLGGMDFSYSKKRHHSRCDYVCGGFTGLHKSGKWSTWSPARFHIPEKDEDFHPALVKSVGPFLKRPRPAQIIYNVLMPGDRVELTCGNCQLICHPDKEIRQKRYKMLTESGVIVENPAGSREAVSPAEAKKRLAAMDPEIRALYEEV